MENTLEQYKKLITLLEKATIEDIIKEKYSVNFTEVIITRQRQINKIKTCIDALQSIDDNLDTIEVFAEKIRIAANSLGAIVGLIDAEEVLDEIFENFCIGK